MITITRRDSATQSTAAPEFPRKQNMLLAFSAGALLAIAFPPVPLGMAALVALVPFLVVIERQRSLAAAFRYSYLTFLVANAGTIYWISGWWGDDPWLKVAGVIVNLVHPLLFTIPGMLLYFIRRRLGPIAMAAGFPFLWTTWEWLTHLPELSFPWMLLANTQTYDYVGIQYITATGSFGITMWVAVMNALFYVLLLQLQRGLWKLTSRQTITAASAAALLLLLPKVHGMMVISDAEPTGRSMTIGIVQPDINPYDKWGSGETPMMKLDMLLRMYDSLAAYGPEVILMPETAIPFRILQASYREEWLELRRRIDSAGVPLLTGFPHTVFYDDPGTAPGSARRIPDTDIRYHDFNSAMLVEPGNDVPQIYHKSRLTPLSERIPYLDAMPFLQDALTWGVGISNWGQGNDTTVFRLGARESDTGLWAMICYETLYPSFVAGFAARGAEVFGVITNDGWFGPTSGPYQLQRYTVLRAIENRRDVARCANNGVSCFISKYGEVRNQTELYTRTGILGIVQLNDELTFYARHGDWLPIGTTVVTGLLLILSIIVVHYKK
jgi:apolipoprotein N-acyltransferase